MQRVDTYLIASEPPTGPSKPPGLSVAESHRERTDAVRQRMKLQPASNHHAGLSGTSLNTATLLAHQSAGGSPGEQKAMVCWQVCR